MGLVKHQKIETGSGKQLHVPLAGQKKFQLFDVGQKDARLPALRIISREQTSSGGWTVSPLRFSLRT